MKQISELASEGIDYLIINGADLNSHQPPRARASNTAASEQTEAQESQSKGSTVGGMIHTVETFAPLVKISKSKKVVLIATQLAMTNNMLATKYWLNYEADGIVFLAMSPGLLVAAARDPNSSE